MKIAATFIASLPHSPSKPIVTSSLETASTSLIVTTIDTSNVQSLFTPTQLSVSLIEVTSTSSIELQPPSSSATEQVS